MKARSSDEVEETENEKLAVKARSSDKVQEIKKEKASVKARSSDKVQETEDEKLNGGEEDEKDALDDENEEVCICEFSVNCQVWLTLKKLSRTTQTRASGSKVS